MVDKAKAIDPLTVAYFNYQTLNLYFLEDYEAAIQTIDEALKLYPAVLRFYDFQARVNLTKGDFAKTISAVETGLRSSNVRPPPFE